MLGLRLRLGFLVCLYFFVLRLRQNQALTATFGTRVCSPLSPVVLGEAYLSRYRFEAPISRCYASFMYLETSHSRF